MLDVQEEEEGVWSEGNLWERQKLPVPANTILVLQSRSHT